LIVEIVALLPCPPILVRFLNRPTTIDLTRQQDEEPRAYIARTGSMLDAAWRKHPSGSTPALEAIRKSFVRPENRDRAIGRYFFGDGEPDGGDSATQEITRLLVNRRDPSRNPFTFMSCTNDDEATEWMKECEEAAPYCAELDDYLAECAEVLGDQGKAFPFSYGTYLVASLVGAMCPDDLDAMDEAVPFAKATLENLQGYVLTAQEYRFYFENFLAAQRAKAVTTAIDREKKQFAAALADHIDSFATAPVARALPMVKEYHRRMAALATAHAESDKEPFSAGYASSTSWISRSCCCQ